MVDIPHRPKLNWVSPDEVKSFTEELHACGQAMRQLTADGKWHHVPLSEWYATAIGEDAAAPGPNEIKFPW